MPENSRLEDLGAILLSDPISWLARVAPLLAPLFFWLIVPLEGSGCPSTASSRRPSSRLPQGPGARPHQSLPPVLSSASAPVPTSSVELPEARDKAGSPFSPGAASGSESLRVISAAFGVKFGFESTHHVTLANFLAPPLVNFLCKIGG